MLRNSKCLRTLYDTFSYSSPKKDYYFYKAIRKSLIDKNKFWMVSAFAKFLWSRAPFINFVKRIGGVGSGDKSTQWSLVSKFLLCVFVGRIWSTEKKRDSKVRENCKSKIFHWVTKINGRHLITFTLPGSVHVIYSLLFDWFSLWKESAYSVSTHTWKRKCKNWSNISDQAAH